MNAPVKRTRIFVNRQVQGRILLRITKYWLFYNVALWHGLVLVDFHRYGIPAILNGSPLNVFHFYCQFAASHALLLVLSAGLFPFILWDMMKLTHQIAGPLVRFGNSLRKMTNGEPVSKVQLREGDLLGEFQDAFNEFLASGRLIVGDQPTTAASSASPEETVLNAATQLKADLETQSSASPRAETPATARA